MNTSSGRTAVAILTAFHGNDLAAAHDILDSLDRDDLNILVGGLAGVVAGMTCLLADALDVDAGALNRTVLREMGAALAGAP